MSYSTLLCGPTDYVRFGLVFLHNGLWNGIQILPEAWVNESTSPLDSDPRDWGPTGEAFLQDGGYSKYHWAGFRNADGTHDFFASGHYDQYIYVAPRKNLVIVRLGNTSATYRVVWPLIMRSLVDQIS